MQRFPTGKLQAAEVFEQGSKINAREGSTIAAEQEPAARRGRNSTTSTTRIGAPSTTRARSSQRCPLRYATRPRVVGRQPAKWTSQPTRTNPKIGTYVFMTPEWESTYVRRQCVPEDTHGTLVGRPSGSSNVKHNLPYKGPWSTHNALTLVVIQR